MRERDLPVIAIWGDSITWGKADVEHGGWAELLKTHFGRNGFFETEVYNVGISGDKLENVLLRFDVEADARGPSTIVLAIGINDSAHDTHPGGTDLGKFRLGYQELIAKALRRTDRIVVVGPTEVDEASPDHSYKNSEIIKYREIIRDVAAENRLSFVDLVAVLNADDLKEDGLHPNASGHQKIFETVLGELK